MMAKLAKQDPWEMHRKDERTVFLWLQRHGSTDAGRTCASQVRSRCIN